MSNENKCSRNFSRHLKIFLKFNCHISFNKRIQSIFNFKAVKYSDYWPGAILRGKCLFQSKKSYSHVMPNFIIFSFRTRVTSIMK